jgi:hypothetical protein
VGLGGDILFSSSSSDSNELDTSGFDLIAMYAGGASDLFLSGFSCGAWAWTD